MRSLKSDNLQETHGHDGSEYGETYPKSTMKKNFGVGKGKVHSEEIYEQSKSE